MSVRNNYHRISLASIFICFFIPQVQAGSWDDAAIQHSDVDIIGLELGMTQDQVIAALKKHNKDFDIRSSEHKSQKAASENDPLAAWGQASEASRCFQGQLCQGELPDHVISINASTKASGIMKETLAIEFFVPPSTNVVKHISRRVGLGTNGTLKATVLTALTKKYGAPTNKGLQVLVWNNEDNPAISEKCSAEIERSIKSNKYWQGIRNTDDCGLVLTTVMNANDSGVVHQMNSVLVDYSALRREKLAVEEFRIQKLKEQEETNRNKASQSSAPTL